MRLPSWAPAAVLLVVAITSGLVLWRMYREEHAPELVGPPRSDYFLIDFELVSLDSSGNEAFSVTGPLLSRHPLLGTITIDEPRFWFPTEDSTPWAARADRAWAAADGAELRLDGDVTLDAPPDDIQGAMSFRSESLVIFPKDQRASSEAVVEFTSAQSILQGRGFRADLQTRRFQLLNEVIGRYDTPTSASHH